MSGQKPVDGNGTTTERVTGNVTGGWEGAWTDYRGQDYRKEIFPPITPGKVNTLVRVMLGGEGGWWVYVG